MRQEPAKLPRNVLRKSKASSIDISALFSLPKGTITISRSGELVAARASGLLQEKRKGGSCGGLVKGESQTEKDKTERKWNRREERADGMQGTTRAEIAVCPGDHSKI
jgi:hypothetical protein